MVKINGKTMPEIFQNQVKKYGDRVCVSHLVNGEYKDVSWNQMDDMVRKLSWYLLSIGIKKGDGHA